MGSAFAAGAGADMLRQVLQEKFTQALALAKLNEDARQANLMNEIHHGTLQQGQQRIGQEGQRIDLEGRRVGMEGRGLDLRERQYEEGAPQRAAELSHTTAETGELQRRPVAEESARSFTGKQNDLNRQNAVRIAGIQGQTARDVAHERADNATVTIQTVDANGNPVTRIVPKVAGTEFSKPPSATTQARIDSAKTVNDVGNDLIRELSDPKFAATVGPVMGRYSSLQDFIGNPPPEFSRLAGEIESYSLANMGVHGMRSAHGAEMIQKLLTGHHTPQSLIATIQGLQQFSQQFVKNATPGGGGPQGGDAQPAPPAPPAGKPNPQDLIKKYGGG